MVPPEESEVVDRVRRVLGSGDGAALVLLIEGAAGTGKSRLLRHLRAAVPDGVECAALSAAGHLPSARLRRGGTAGSASPVGSSGEDPAARPALLVVDDVQEAGDAARRLLWETVRTARRAQVLALAYRPEELPLPGLPLGRPLTPPTGTTVLRHRVEPLDLAGVRRLAATRLGPSALSSALVVPLHRMTGGVAQVVVDVLEMLDPPAPGGPPLTSGAVSALEPPPRLSELVRARTAALPVRCRPLVWAAAILGGPAAGPGAGPASAAELAEMAGLSEAAGQEALVRVLEAAVLQELGPDAYGFAVPLAADAVAAALPGPRRAVLHRAAARVLTGRRQPPWPSVAAHLEAGGQERGRLRAVQRAIGEHIEARRPDEADRLLRRTLADRRLAVHSRARLAAATMAPLMAALPITTAQRLFSSIAGDPALPGAVRGQARISLTLALCGPLPPDRDGWLHLERTACGMSGQPALEARVLSGMAIPHWPGATLAEHLNWLERAETAAATVAEPALHAAVAANGVSLLLTVGAPHADRHLATAPGPDGEPEHLHHWARGLSNAADAATWLGRYREARVWLDQSLAHPGRPHTDSTTSLAGRSAALLLDCFTGRWTGLAERAEGLVAQVPDSPVLGTDAHLVLATLALAQGEWQQVTDRLLGPGAPTLDAQLVPIASAASALLIRLALARGDTEAARALADTAWTRLRRKGIWAWAAEVAPWAVTAALAAGRPAEAEALADEFARGLRRPPLPAAEAAAHWCAAALAAEAGDHAEARRRYQASAAGYATLPRPYLAALATEAAARAALSADDRTAARQDLETAVRTLADLGATWDTARVRAALRLMEHRRGRPPHAPGLSPREREVADLAAHGLTNREIADTLHLSPRTVEQHVSRAMRKLSAPSRRALALPPPDGP
ncbi:helix-turn-helix transcriptional regulator [Streptomyces sp. LP11]|uniref:Helix-turn-helix transcriptional regulator n=1 Tax=Streptomyces pyxinicus TaxID=2970331 RepID=A0ABT2B2R4_9ACTN|nr:helix-turn-helix transcriptional regulator [Streptomyces sp. LP11]MCS0602238.1 helix-turn-helix transcriptional regulator [Streptomyces sp. LP11]